MGFQGGLNPYAYVNGNPVNVSDPAGLYVEVAVSGNDVTLTLPIMFQGPNATPAAIQAYTQAIAKAWCGAFGQYQVQMRVITPAPDTARSQYNIAEIGPLNPDQSGGRPFADEVGGNYMKLGPLTRVPESDQYPVWTAGHEAGHLMDLVDQYNAQGPLPGYENNIMGKDRGIPSQVDIAMVIWLKSIGDRGGHPDRPGPENASAQGAQNLTTMNPAPPPKN